MAAKTTGLLERWVRQASERPRRQQGGQGRPIAVQRTPSGLPQVRSAREYPISVINHNSHSEGDQGPSRATDSGGFVRRSCETLMTVLLVPAVLLSYRPCAPWSFLPSSGHEPAEPADPGSIDDFRVRPGPGFLDSELSDVNPSLDSLALALSRSSSFFSFLRQGWPRLQAWRRAVSFEGPAKYSEDRHNSPFG